MRKKALIVGCSGSEQSFLPGVQRDIENFRNFLKSPNGGHWFESEIVSLYNPTELELQEEIESLKSQNLDFSFVVFSGHGEYSEVMGCRRLYLTNSKFVYEKDMLKISPKQLTIIDSCAETDDMILESKMEKSAGLERLYSSVIKDYRRLYELSIERCKPQAINLYSCDIDEYSQDTSKGAMYAAHLLSVAMSNSSNEVLNALEAHAITSEVVTKKTQGDQNPQYICTAKFGDKLPISVH